MERFRVEEHPAEEVTVNDASYNPGLLKQNISFLFIDGDWPSIFQLHATILDPVTVLKSEKSTHRGAQPSVGFAENKTVGDGLMVIVYELGMPVHPFAEGVTVMVDIIVAKPVLIVLNAGRPPNPLAIIPMDGSEFVQVKVAPAVGLV